VFRHVRHRQCDSGQKYTVGQKCVNSDWMKRRKQVNRALLRDHRLRNVLSDSIVTHDPIRRCIGFRNRNTSDTAGQNSSQPTSDETAETAGFRGATRQLSSRTSVRQYETTRRSFLRIGGAVAVGLAGCQLWAAVTSPRRVVETDRNVSPPPIAALAATDILGLPKLLNYGTESAGYRPGGPAEGTDSYFRLA
jgi:hypothetical protein